MKSQPETNSQHGDIGILLKIGSYFIHHRDIRSFARFGKGTKIMLASGEEIVVNIPYDKIAALIENAGK